MDIDDLLLRDRADVGVRRKRKAKTPAPAPACPDRIQEAPDVDSNRRNRLARQNPLEMVACQAVLALEEERPCQFKAHPHQARLADQDAVQRRDRLVQKRILPVFRDPRPLRGPDRRQGGKKMDVGDPGMVPRQGAQEGQGLVEPAVSHQRPRLRHSRLGRHARTVLGVRRRNGKYKKD